MIGLQDMRCEELDVLDLNPLFQDGGGLEIPEMGVWRLLEVSQPDDYTNILVASKYRTDDMPQPVEVYGTSTDIGSFWSLTLATRFPEKLDPIEFTGETTVGVAPTDPGRAVLEAVGCQLMCRGGRATAYIASPPEKVWDQFTGVVLNVDTGHEDFPFSVRLAMGPFKRALAVAATYHNTLEVAIHTGLINPWRIREDG